MLYHKQVPIFGFILLATLLAGCNRKRGPAKLTNVSFYQQIDKAFPALQIKPNGYVNQPFGAVIAYLMVDPVHGYLITNNYKKESIQLYDAAGDSLLFATGRKGKGPGEFLSISQLTIGYNGALFVLDSTLNRITKFKIEHRQLKYETSFLIKPPSGLYVNAIYATKYGDFGVFDRYYNPKTSEQNYYFYRLDSTFSPVKRLLKLPGTQMVTIHSRMHIPSLIGVHTFWDLEGKWFYYITSKSSQVTMYNLKTGQLKTQQYFKIGNRPNTQAKTETIENYYNLFNTVALQKTESLPIFSGFHVSGNWIFFNIFHLDGKEGRIIRINRTTEKVKVIKTPYAIDDFTIGDSLVYGVVTTNKSIRKIRVLYLK